MVTKNAYSTDAWHREQRDGLTVLVLVARGNGIRQLDSPANRESKHNKQKTNHAKVRYPNRITGPVARAGRLGPARAD